MMMMMMMMVMMMMMMMMVTMAAAGDRYGLATRSDLERVAQAWADWAANPDSIFYYVNGELLARVPPSRTPHP
jgi:hypothetical protein